MAIAPGQGSWNGHAYEAAKTADAVTDEGYTIAFGQNLATAWPYTA